MLQYYQILYTTYKNGVNVGDSRGFAIVDENEAKEETIPITWENLEKVYWDYGCRLPFNKTPELDMKLVITYKVVSCSLNDILKYWDSEKAIQYLRERNLSCPIDILKQS